MLEWHHLRGDTEIGVVVNHGHVVSARHHGGEQVGDTYRAMTSRFRQAALGFEGGLPMVIVGRQVFVGVMPV